MVWTIYDGAWQTLSTLLLPPLSPSPSICVFQRLRLASIFSKLCDIGGYRQLSPLQRSSRCGLSWLDDLLEGIDLRAFRRYRRRKTIFTYDP